MSIGTLEYPHRNLDKKNLMQPGKWNKKKIDNKILMHFIYSLSREEIQLFF